MTRRALLTGAAAVGAGALVAARTASGAEAEEPGTSPDPLPLLVGIVAVAGSRGVTVQPTLPGRSPVTVTPVTGARVWRLGDAKLSDFRVGDDISVYGTVQEDGSIAATMVSCDLYSVQGAVSAPRADSIVVGGTALSVSGRMLPASSEDDGDDFRRVGPGDVPRIRTGSIGRALYLRNSRGPGLVWQLGVQ